MNVILPTISVSVSVPLSYSVMENVTDILSGKRWKSIVLWGKKKNIFNTLIGEVTLLSKRGISVSDFQNYVSFYFSNNKKSISSNVPAHGMKKACLEWSHHHSADSSISPPKTNSWMCGMVQARGTWLACSHS